MVEKKTTKSASAVDKPAVHKAAPKTPAKPRAPRKPAVKKAETKTEAVKHVHVAAPVAVEVGVKSTEKMFKTLGRRKEATASVWLIAGGKGNITINGKPLEQYFTIEWDRQNILAPLLATGHRDDHDVSVKVEGGGIQGQSIAVRHGIARALLLLNEDYRKTLRAAGFLTRDPRAKERKKPGLKRARKRGQWAKR
jgi:small subunit ribosomal protein S9